MSLVIHTMVHDGFVICADSRTTDKTTDNNGRVCTRHDDTAEKIIPFPNNPVVTHCGDARINNEIPDVFLQELLRSPSRLLALITI